MPDRIPAGHHTDEPRWFQRRQVLQAAAAWTGLGGWAAAQAQNRSNIVQLQGVVMLNGNRLLPQHTVQTGDSLQTGPDSSLIFVIGNAAFMVRQNSYLRLERGATLNTVSILRLLSGAVASVWGNGPMRRIVTPTLTANLRNMGTYTEVFPAQDNRSYFCNCHGMAQLESGGSWTRSRAQYHQAFWAHAALENGSHFTSAPSINHSDDELEFLSRLVGQRTAWQLAGRKGNKDGKGLFY